MNALLSPFVLLPCTHLSLYNYSIMSSSSDLPHSCHKILALHVESVSTPYVFSLLLQITLHLLIAYFAVALPSEHIMPIVFELLVLIQFLMAFCNLCMQVAFSYSKLNFYLKRDVYKCKCLYCLRLYVRYFEIRHRRKVNLYSIKDSY